MALDIPEFPNPFDKASPLANAYAWIAGLHLDLSADQGRIVLNVHPNEAAWQDRPVGQLGVALGQVLVRADPDAVPPTAEVRFPRLDELMASAETVGETGVTFAQAYAVIGQALYGELVAKVPALAGASLA